jgi:CheY-like chemotaxis protein
LQMNTTLEISSPATVTKSPRFEILLADDDQAIRQILVRLLADEGYSVSTANTGEAALQLARTQTFDLVLLDLNLPAKDGWETFERLANGQPGLPIILITASPDKLSPILGSNFVAMLEKPLDLAVLFSTIHNFLEEPLETRLSHAMGRS